MRPLSCRSTTFSSRPRSGPENRLCAATSVVMTSLSVIASAAKQSIPPRKERMDCFVASLLAMTKESVRRIHQFTFRARRQELAREDFRGRRRPGQLIALHDDADGAGHAV